MHSPSAPALNVAEPPDAALAADAVAAYAAKVARQRWQAAASVGAAAFALYLFCLSSTVTYTGDCGELIAASYRLGIAHPTGYPLYCLLGRLFAALIPFGEVGGRYNLMSAVLGTGMVSLMTATVHRLTVNPYPAPEDDQSLRHNPPSPLYDQWPALGAGLLLAGYYFVSSQCVIAEVSTLEGIAECALFYCAVAWHQEGDWRWAYMAALVFGCAIVAHLTSVFTAPGLFLYIVWQHRHRFGQSTAATPAARPAEAGLTAPNPAPKSFVRSRVLVMVTLPILVYCLTVYLPLRSQLYPEPVPPRAWAPLDWTHPVDLSRWITHVTARQYRIHLIQPTSVAIAGHQLQIPWLVKPLSKVPGDLFSLLIFTFDSYLWFTPLILVGALMSLRAGAAVSLQRQTGGRWLGASLFVIFLLNVGVEINYDVSDQSNFFFPAYMVMAIWMGLGISAMLRVSVAWGERLSQRTGNPLWRWRLATLSWLLVLGTVAVEWTIYTGISSFRGVTAARDAALERADATERLARQSHATPILLLMEDDSLWGFWYAHYVLDRAPRVRTPWGPLRNQLMENQRLVDYVTNLQHAGPVAINKFDGEVDQRFPYTPLTPSGNLWLASHRALPPPATLAADLEGDAATGPGGIISARFRRSPLTHLKTDPAAEDFQGLSPAEAGALRRFGLGLLKRDDMAIFDVDFTVSPALIQQLAKAPVDRAHKAAQVGWVEVLLARRGYMQGTPAPGPHEMKVTSNMSPPIMVTTQQHRLVVPLSIQPGQLLHAVLPMQIEGDTVSDLYYVWTRLITTPRDRTTPWQRTDLVRLTVD